MGLLGYIQLEQYLSRVNGEVSGRVVTDGKDRYYNRCYEFSSVSASEIIVKPCGSIGDGITLKKRIPLDESLVAFFGLYSGDGAKGVEDSRDRARILPTISLSQREPHLVAYATEQFRKIFGTNISFSFQVGEDSALFMAGDGHRLLMSHYGGIMPALQTLDEVRPRPSQKDIQYLQETRPNGLNNCECLAFYYQHKSCMEEILVAQKTAELSEVGIILNAGDKVSASVRRPFKKGARAPGGTSRSDELSISGINGFGELFLKIMHEMEQSIYEDKQTSSSSLIKWLRSPSNVGDNVDIKEFFEQSPYAELGGTRADVRHCGPIVMGQWRRGIEYELSPYFRIDPLWCYVSGLYLAEGSTPKSAMFKMYNGHSQSFSFGFTSTENESIELIIRSMKKLFKSEDCINTWKIKVGSQYFPELVVIGLKNGVPMLRGGASGDGKLRTMEISLSVKQWALDVAPCLVEYADKFSHVEPTGAGIPRIDISASSSICRWYFPLLMYAVFKGKYPEPNWR